jgi:hypothetical protein
LIGTGRLVRARLAASIPRLLVAGLVACFLASVHVACGSNSRDFFTVPYDAGNDAPAAKGDADTELDPTIGGPCSEDTQCDDLVACTFDRCDRAISRCRNTPDDAQCSDQEYCNGQEKCVLRQGCVSGPVVSCQDEDFCTIDRCVEATKQCEHVIRDSDGDGDPDDHCALDKDCDDTDPTVSSTRAEICGNFKDDNCNGEVDEEPCATPANDVCATALAVHAPGTFLLTSVAAKKDYTTTCSVITPAAARDLVVAVTVPAGGTAKDVVVRAVTSVPPTDVAVALRTTCAEAASEVSCGHVASTGSARAIARSVAAGATVYAIVATQNESAVDVTVDLLPPTSKPTNEACAAPLPVNIDTPFTVALIDAAADLPSGCSSKVGELTYSFELSGNHDVRIFASTLTGPGTPVVSMRSSSCLDELRCRVGSTPPVYARSLPTGTYVFSVGATAQIDATVIVKTYPETATPSNQSCATAPLLEPNTTLNVDLAGQEDAIRNGCLPGAPNAAYALNVTQPSDVLLVARVPNGDIGAVSLNHPECGTTDLIACSTGGGAPLRVSRRNVAQGSYRVVTGDQKGLSSEILALVRPTVIPTAVTTETCIDAMVIPETGGYFTGNTTNATAKFSAGCDSAGQDLFGAKDQMLRLTLTQPRRVIFDMIGSTFPTLLDVRSGDACPGIEVPNGCAVGVSANRSFLDIVLPAGTHWVQVDGYGGATGAWNLDVRVLPPPPP